MGSILLVFANVLVSRSDPMFTREVENRAFSAGEYLSFSIEYGPIPAGTAVMEVKDGLVTVDENPCYHVVSSARSSRVFSLFFLVNDRLESFIDINGIFPRKFKKTLREGKYKAARVVYYDQEKRLAISAKDTTEIPPFAQDVLSVLYYVRTLELEVGKNIAIDNHSGRTIYPLEMSVVREERVTVEAGTFDCYVVAPLPRGGAFRKKGSLRVWLTKDERKMPVLMKSKVFFGSIAAKLTDYKTGR